jgi:hypothetical protein
MEEAKKLTVELAGLVQEFCHGEVRYDLINKDRSEVDI